MKDFSFQGRIELGERLASGRPGKLVWVGDQSSCELTFNTQTEDRTETHSGQRLQAAQLRTGTPAGIELVLRHGAARNLHLGRYATPQNVASGSVSAELLPPGLVAGSRVVLAKPANVKSLVLTDSDSPANTLVAGEDYVLESEHSGIIRLLNVAELEQPLK